MNKLKDIGRWINILLLTVVVMAILTLLIWLFFRPIISSMDGKIVNYYVSHYADRFYHAKQILGKDQDMGIILLEELVADLGEVHKLYRLDPIKRGCFKLLSQSLTSENSFERALHWSEKWLEFDDKDIEAQIQHGKALFLIPDRQIEGSEVLTELYLKIPESQLVVEAYAALLIEQGKDAAAFLVEWEGFVRNKYFIETEWYIYWDNGQGFNSKLKSVVSPVIVGKNVLKLSFEVPAGAEKLRIDPPAFSNIAIEKPTIVFFADNKREIAPLRSLDLLEIPLTFNQISRYRSSLMTQGKNDPFFYWDLPNIFHVQVLQCDFSANVIPTYPDSLLDLAGQVDPLRVEGELVAMGKNFEAEMFLDVRLKYFEKMSHMVFEKIVNLPFEVFWRIGNEGFSQTRKRSSTIMETQDGGVKIFELKVPINSNVSELRIDFPVLAGANYKLEDVAVSAGGIVKNINIAEVIPSSLNMIEKDGNLFHVSGEDPYFSFSLSGGEQYVECIIIKGMIQ